jgi:hypothetical protein
MGMMVNSYADAAVGGGGGGGPGAHRYWRLLCRKNAGGGFTGISELELRSTSGGADETGSGTPLGSGSIQAGSLAAVFDNSTSTGVQWNGTGAGLFIGYDFGAGNDKAIIEINVLPRHDSADRTFAEFDFQYSDDNASWTTAWSGSYTAWVIGTTVTFSQPSAAASRYWRVRGDTLGSGTSMSCAELELRETVGGADATGSGTASASSQFSSQFPSLAFDNSAATFWSGSADVAQCSWLKYDFGVGVTKEIAQISYTARNDAFFTQAPTAGWIECSSDGRAFLSRKYFSALGWSAGASNTVTV